MNNKIQETQKRLIRYDYVDGTPDMAFGGLCLLMTVIFAIFASFPVISSSTFSALIVWVVFSGGGLLIAWLSQKLKERVTFPRTGYVAYRRQGRPITRTTKLLIRIGLPLLTVILLAILFLNRSKFPAQNQDTTLYPNPGLMGLMFSVIMGIIGWKMTLPRYYVIAVAVFLISAVFLFRVPSGNYGLALISGVMGLILFISGGVTLWKYLRSTRSSQDNQPEE